MYRKALKALAVAGALIGTSTAGAGVAISQMPAAPDVAPQAVSAQPALYVPVTPTRLLDTRDGTGGTLGPVGAGDSITFQATGVAGIPANATSVALNVTAVDASAPSYLTIWPADQARPFASSLNPQPGEGPTPNAVTSGVSAGGSVAIFNAVGSVHVIADIAGYYIPAGTAVVGISRRSGFTPGFPAAAATSGDNLVIYQVALPAGSWYADYSVNLDIAALDAAGRAGAMCSIQAAGVDTAFAYQTAVASAPLPAQTYTRIGGSGTFTLTAPDTVNVTCHQIRTVSLTGTTTRAASTFHPAEGAVLFTPVEGDAITDYRTLGTSVHDADGRDLAN